MLLLLLLQLWQSAVEFHFQFLYFYHCRRDSISCSGGGSATSGTAAAAGGLRTRPSCCKIALETLCPRRINWLAGWLLRLLEALPGAQLVMV